MIIDIILDRKDGYDYSPNQFYRNVLDYGRAGFAIGRAMDYGEEQDVKNALCDYVIHNQYNEDICKYIKSVDWL